MAKVTINNQGIEFEGKLNLIQVAAQAGILIPHYCFHPALSVVGSCRMCLVEIGEVRDGEVSMMPKLVPACNTLARDGMICVTTSEKVRNAQKAVLENLLINHPLDCPVCDQAGECLLQDFSYAYGRAFSRFTDQKIKQAKKDVGDHVVLFADRCILCTRCVRFTREIAGTAELCVTSRGAHSEIDVFPGNRLNNLMAGNVVDICPVGALCDKEFLYRMRVWFLQSTPSVCPLCSAGCSIRIDHNKGRIYRLVPRLNPEANGHWMCDVGRYGFGYTHAPQRLARVQRREGDALTDADYREAIGQIVERFTAAGAAAAAAILSPFLTVQEAYLLARFIKGVSPEAKLALGPVPREGEDIAFKNGFTISAERAPNRRGVEAVLAHFQGEVLSFEAVLDAAKGGDLKALYVTGGYPRAWIDKEACRRLGKLDALVVQDTLPTPLSDAADFVLPGAAPAEKDGAFVNGAGLLQTIEGAFPPPGEARPDGQILWDLLGREGLFVASSVLEEMAGEVPAFEGIDPDKVGETGIQLKV